MSENKNKILELFVDATEQPINRPKRGQKKWYSGKKKRHTIKHQMIVSKDGKIKGISKSCCGKVHDKINPMEVQNHDCNC